MDYSKFQSDDFDVKEWVNNAFKAQKDGNNEQYATTLVMKLQMFIQEVNKIIEESCQQAVNNLPRVSRELEAVKQEASLLQEQMKIVKYDIQKVEHDTAQSMQTLLKLDSVKTRMKLASDALREADNWSTLSGDVEEVFDSQNIDAIAEKLRKMKQSLLILTDVPDYIERCQYLELLKNSLVAMLSPHVMNAFSTLSLDSAQKYARIFSDIEHTPQLAKYYRQCHVGRLQNVWKDLISKHKEEGLVKWLTEFYQELLIVWQDQLRWCGQVFSEPIPVISALLTETLGSLDPGLAACIASPYLENYNGSKVVALIEIRQVTDRFAKRLETDIEQLEPGTLQLPCIEKLAVALYAPYRGFVRKFCEYEQSTLSASLEAIRLDHVDILESVNLLSQSVSKLFSAAQQSNERCIQLTSGVGYTHLPQVLQDYLKQYVTEFERVLSNIRAKCKLNSSDVTSLTSASSLVLTTDSDDWASFQSSLRIIQTCGDLVLHVDELDQLIVSSIFSTVAKYCQPITSSQSHRDPTSIRSELRRNPISNYRLLLVDSVDDRHNLESLVTRLEEGDNPTVLLEAREKVFTLCEHVHRFTFDIVFNPLQLQLQQLANMQVWSSETAGEAITANLPSFSLAPQEYITKVGQYLMTLPQQLEPFTMEDSPVLAVALKHGKLPYTGDIAELPSHLADLWLESVARGTMHVYTEQILKIHELTHTATKQLTVDIDYLINVLEDLGLSASDTLRTVVGLLKAEESEYSELSENCPQRLSRGIAHMRGLRVP